jgi:hypothetical protein
MASEDSREPKLDEPFLLIVRTRGIFTAGLRRRVARDTRMSQHIVGFCNRPFRVTTSVPTVIVTAAVYRGLASRLRPKANLSA